MEKRTIWMGGLLVLLLIGVVFAVSAQIDGDNTSEHFWGKYKHGVVGKGLGFHSGFFDGSAKLELFKEKLNLSEYATKEDVFAALQEKKANWKGQHADRLERVKAKFGLTKNTSNEDVQGACQQWRKGNKDSLFSHGIRGFHQWKR